MKPIEARNRFSRDEADAMREARVAYGAGKDAGEGFPPGYDEVQDAADNLGLCILSRYEPGDVEVVLDGDKVIAIGGDAAGCGAWAVDITDRLPVKR